MNIVTAKVAVAVAVRGPLLAGEPPSAPAGQRGYVMVVSLLILLLITVLSMSMAKSFFLEEGMAGNIREKSRSFSAAQAAVAYGEWFVTQGTASAYGVACPAAAPVLAAATICTNQVVVNATPNATTKPLGVYFPLPATTVLPTASITGLAGGTDTFYAAPGVYIQFIGLVGEDYVYQITGYGYGGSLNSLSIVQSMYLAAPSAKSL